MHLEQLPRTAFLHIANINVIAEHQQKRIIADKLLCLIDGMAESFGGRLLREVKAFAERGELFAFENRPVFAAEALDHVVIEPLEVFAILALLAGLRDDAEFLDPAVDRLLPDDLDDRLGQTVPVDEGKHFLLHRAGRWILPSAAAGGGDNGLSNLSHGSFLSHFLNRSSNALTAVNT